MEPDIRNENGIRIEGNERLSINEIDSKRITSLRFLLMLLVMIKHNAIVKGLFMHELPFHETKIVNFIKEFFADGLGELAVPVFFIFSSYLLASSVDSYITKLKKRFRSIVVPYTIWTVFYFGVWLILKKYNIVTGFANPVMDWHEWTFRDYILRFLGYYQGFRFPFVGSFWFLRDLMILIVFSPVLIFLTKKIPFFVIVSTLLGEIFNLLTPFIMRQSLLYFEIGLVFAIYKINFFAFCDKVHWRDLLISFCFGIVFFLVTENYMGNDAFQKTFPFYLFSLSGIILLLKVSKAISENEKIFKFAKYLAPLTFFVYAIHGPVLVEIIKKWTFFIKMPLIQFVTACILDIGISISIAFLVRKICPKIFFLLSGGKRNK